MTCRRLHSGIHVSEILHHGNPRVAAIQAITKTGPAGEIFLSQVTLANTLSVALSGSKVKCLRFAVLKVTVKGV